MSVLERLHSSEKEEREGEGDSCPFLSYSQNTLTLTRSHSHAHAHTLTLTRSHLSSSHEVVLVRRPIKVQDPPSMALQCLPDLQTHYWTSERDILFLLHGSERWKRREYEYQHESISVMGFACLLGRHCATCVASDPLSSLWHLSGVSAACLPRCPPRSRPIWTRYPRHSTTFWNPTRAHSRVLECVHQRVKFSTITLCEPRSHVFQTHSSCVKKGAEAMLKVRN